MSVLSEVRAKLSTNEFSIIDDQPAMMELWNRMQELREEMNEAKKQAAQEAAKPYLEIIEKIEKQYAMLLRLSS